MNKALCVAMLPAGVAMAATGESAGGHIVALIGATIGARYGHELLLAAVVPFFPPTDMEALEVGADKNPNAMVALFVHGTADQLVNFRQPQEILPVEGGGHALGSWERDPAKQPYKLMVPECLLRTVR
jgi:predicted alpha/beta-hydrolase family hydrolase